MVQKLKKQWKAAMKNTTSICCCLTLLKRKIEFGSTHQQARRQKRHQSKAGIMYNTCCALSSLGVWYCWPVFIQAVRTKLRFLNIAGGFGCLNIIVPNGKHIEVASLSGAEGSGFSENQDFEASQSFQNWSTQPATQLDYVLSLPPSSYLENKNQLIPPQQRRIENKKK